MRITAAALAWVVVVFGVSSCAPTEVVSEAPSVSSALATAQARGFEWEVSILEDGDIMADEYERAYDRYMDCQRELGYVFDKPKYLDPVEAQRWHALSVFRGAGDPPAEAIAECEERIFLVEDVYVLLTPKRMDPQLLAKFKQCLDEAGIGYTGDEVNFNDFVADVGDEEYGDSESQYTTCLVDSAFELYPDLIAVGFGR